MNENTFPHKSCVRQKEYKYLYLLCLLSTYYVSDIVLSTFPLMHRVLLFCLLADQVTVQRDELISQVIIGEALNKTQQRYGEHRHRQSILLLCN